MSKSFQAVGPSVSTEPAPPSTDLEAKIAEVMGALQQFGTLATELQDMFRATRLAQLTGEHRMNVQRAKINRDRMFLGDHERRLREVEKFTPLLEELLLERGTAAE